VRECRVTGELVNPLAEHLSISPATAQVFFNDPRCPSTAAGGEARSRDARAGRELAVGWRKRGYELGLGAGLAVGYATLGRIGFEGRYDYGALGSVTNLAARLSDAAVSRQILLSQRAYAALEERVEAKPVAPLQMKGIARPEQAYELNAILELH
jgi:class 3 adenylate cyclase